VIISQTRKFIFFHIPKTAGTTVSFHLKSIISRPKDFKVGRPLETSLKHASAGFEPDTKLKKHATPKELLEVMDPAKFDQAFRFAFVRNPFSRTFSGYHFLLSKAKQAEKDGNLTPKLQEYLTSSFDDVLKSIETRGRHYAFQEQVRWFDTPDRFHFLGRTEYMDEDLARVWTVIAPDVQFPVSIDALNVSASRDEWRNMSTEARDIIVKHYAKDFEQLGYSTDLDAPNPAPFPSPEPRA
jgi:RNAse (barnase) inhibitor barstar